MLQFLTGMLGLDIAAAAVLLGTGAIEFGRGIWAFGFVAVMNLTAIADFWFRAGRVVVDDQGLRIRRQWDLDETPLEGHRFGGSPFVSKWCQEQVRSLNFTVEAVGETRAVWN